jgi:hypothetical protein
LSVLKIGIGRTTTRRWCGRRGVWGKKMGRLETVNGNGMCDRSYLEKERVWRTFEDFEGTRIGGRKWWVGRGRKTKTIGEVRRSLERAGSGVCWL